MEKGEKKINLLIITQKVDSKDDLLGFMHGWIEEFSRYFGKVIVICLMEGEHNLPGNVRVMSLGKEKLLNRPNRQCRRLVYIPRLFKFAWQERKNYDKVFVHMNMEYVLLLGLMWRILGKKIGFWYAHYFLTIPLRIAVLFTHVVFTSTRFACRVESKKLNVVGQGIDTDIFRKKQIPDDDKNNILFLGRISPVKDLDTLLEAFKIINNSNKSFFLNIVGGPGDNDRGYFQKIKIKVKDGRLEDRVKFWGPVSNRETLDYYNSNDIFINLTLTGSFDKTTLEAMACERMVLVCNESFKEVFPVEWHNKMIFRRGDSIDLAEKIVGLINLPEEERENVGMMSREIIIKNHGQKNLIKKIFYKLNE